MKIDIDGTLQNAMFEESPQTNTLTLMFGGTTTGTADDLVIVHNVDPELGRLLEMLVKKYERAKRP